MSLEAPPERVLDEERPQHRRTARLPDLEEWITEGAVAHDVNPSDVVVHINLPWMLAAFADKIRPQIKAQADKLLTP